MSRRGRRATRRACFVFAASFFADHINSVIFCFIAAGFFGLCCSDGWYHDMSSSGREGVVHRGSRRARGMEGFGGKGSARNTGLRSCNVWTVQQVGWQRHMSGLAQRKCGCMAPGMLLLFHCAAPVLSCHLDMRRCHTWPAPCCRMTTVADTWQLTCCNSCLSMPWRTPASSTPLLPFTYQLQASCMSQGDKRPCYPYSPGTLPPRRRSNLLIRTHRLREQEGLLKRKAHIIDKLIAGGFFRTGSRIKARACAPCLCGPRRDALPMMTQNEDCMPGRAVIRIVLPLTQRCQAHATCT
jgi:hypothetical protein